MIVRLAQEFGKSEKRRCGAFDASSWFPNRYTADAEGSARETRKPGSIASSGEVETDARQELALRKRVKTRISKPGFDSIKTDQALAGSGSFGLMNSGVRAISAKLALTANFVAACPGISLGYRLSGLQNRRVIGPAEVPGSPIRLRR
jgi:hypothetical protein